MVKEELLAERVLKLVPSDLSTEDTNSLVSLIDLFFWKPRLVLHINLYFYSWPQSTWLNPYLCFILGSLCCKIAFNTGRLHADLPVEVVKNLITFLFILITFTLWTVNIVRLFKSESIFSFMMTLYNEQNQQYNHSIPILHIPLKCTGCLLPSKISCN